MSKYVRRLKKNFDKIVLLVIFISSWFIVTFNYIEENPQDVSTGLIMLSIPFCYAMTRKPFRKFVLTSILVFIKSFRYKSVLPIELRDIDYMDGLQFEKFLKPVFERQGYITEVTKGSGDYGADLILRKGHKKLVVQAKRYSSNIGVSAVQQVVAAVNFYKANGAIVVTNQYFTPAAIQLAKVNGVRLIDRDELARMVL
jgi:restriction system protein